MKKVSKQMRKMEAESKPGMTVGLDMGGRYSHYCLLNEDGDVVEDGRMQSTEAALRRYFEGEPCLRIALECGTHSPWVSRLLKVLGHQVIVANARKIPAITGSESKNDRNDAEKLARFAAYDPKLLSPLEHRSLERQVDLNLIHARATLVRARRGRNGRQNKCDDDFADFPISNCRNYRNHYEYRKANRRRCNDNCEHFIGLDFKGSI